MGDGGGTFDGFIAFELPENPGFGGSGDGGDALELGVAAVHGPIGGGGSGREEEEGEEWGEEGRGAGEWSGGRDHKPKADA